MAFQDVPITNVVPICQVCGLTPEQVITKRWQESQVLDSGFFMGTPGGKFYCNQDWDERQARLKSLTGDGKVGYG